MVGDTGAAAPTMADIVGMMGQMQNDLRTSLDMQMTNMRTQQQQQQQLQQQQSERQMEVVQKLLEKISEPKDQGEGKQKRTDVTREKTFGDLPKLTGKPEAFSSWRFKMFAYLSKDEKFAAVINWIESRKETITIDDMADFEMQDNPLDLGDIKWYNSQLWSVLAANCVDAPLGQIKNLADATEVRGMIAWQRVTRDYRGMSAQRLIGLVERTYAPMKIKRLEDMGNEYDGI